MTKKGNNKENQVKKTNKDGGGGGGKKENCGGDVVVLKMDLHCKGCASKVVKCVKYFDGVVSVKGGENENMNKLTVAGKLDPVKLQEKLEKKTKKKVEIISPIPKKEKEKGKEENDKEMKGNAKKNESSESDEKNKKKPKSDDNKSVKQTDDKNKKDNKAGDKNVKKADEKKSKEPPVTTILLKVNWHCHGCIRKIEEVVTKTKGYVEMSIDRQNNLLTVKGSMDPKVLVEKLQKRLKKSIEIVQPKKGGGTEKGKGGKKGEGGSGGDGESKDGGGGGKNAVNSGGKDGKSNDEGHKMEYVQYEYPYPLVYGSGYLVEYVHAPQIFSDENPNACVVM